MEKQNENLRESLLAHLPQPENLAAYREETTALLAKHARALRWDKITANVLVLIGVFLYLWSFYPGRLGAQGTHSFQLGAAVFYFVGLIYLVRYWVYANQIAALKEIKQVQLQILELQASLNKHDGTQ
jgi:hypothetical protein